MPSATSFRSEGLAEPDDRLDQGVVVRGAVHPAHEGPVDLQRADREPAQVAKRGVPGAEVVDRNADAEVRELMHRRHGLWLLSRQHAFGDLEDQSAGRQPMQRAARW